MQTATLAMTLAMAAVYLLAVRIIDFNEKEPLWAVLSFFVFGAGAAALLTLTVDSVFLELGGAPGVMAKELARFLAIGGGVAVLIAVGSSRGYSEMNGLMDGVVYGSAGGLGFATGLAFARELLLPTAELPLAAASVLGWGQLALVGLGDGVFGALMGIGFALAMGSRDPAPRALGPVGGYLAAVGAHVGYDFIGRANALGEDGTVRRWVSLLFPVVVVAAVAVLALGREKRAIRDELSAETDTGAVSPEELELLESFGKREAAYLKPLLKGDIGTWSALHALHNRQVQLALAKQRAAHEKNADKRKIVGVEVARLRAAVFEIKRVLGYDVPAYSMPSSVAPASSGDEQAKASGQGGG